MEFHGIEDGIDGGRDGAHDENGLGNGGFKDNAKESPYPDEEVGHDRSADETEGTAQPGIGIGEGQFAPMNLHAQSHHDDSDQGSCGILENGPYEGGGHIKAGIFDGKNGHQRINDRHMEDYGKRIPRGEPSLSRLVESQGIQEHIHLDQHHGSCRRSHSKIGRFSVHNVGGIGENESDQGDADISIIGKHGAVLESFDFRRWKSPHSPYQGGQDADAHHDQERNQEDVDHGHVDFRHINAVENEAGQHDEESELRERSHVHFIFPVQHIADEDEDQKGQDIVGNNLKKCHNSSSHPQREKQPGEINGPGHRNDAAHRIKEYGLGQIGRILLVLRPVNDEGHGRWNGGKEEENLLRHRIPDAQARAQYFQNAKGQKRHDNELQGHGGNHGKIGFLKPAPVKLDTDGDGDKDEESPIEMNENGPEESLLQRNFRHFQDESQNCRIEGGHFQKIQEKFGNRSAMTPDEGRAKYIDADIHDDHQDRHGPHGLCQVGMARSFRKRRMGENQHDEGSPDMAGIGKGGNRLELIPHFLPKTQPVTQDGGKNILQDHQENGRRKEQQIRFAPLIAV